MKTRYYFDELTELIYKKQKGQLYFYETSSSIMRKGWDISYWSFRDLKGKIREISEAELALLLA